MKDGLLQFTLREWWGFVRRPRLWATFLVVVLLFAVTGPLGTDISMNAAERFTYWLLLHGFAWSIAIFCALMAGNLLAGRVSSLLARLLAGSLAAALPIGLAVMLLDALFLERPMGLSHLAQAAGISLPLSLLFCVLAYLTVSGEATPGEDARATHPSATPAPAPPGREPDAAPSATSVPLARRLKPENRAPLVRLSAEDHYTDVVTAAGRELLLIRFADALQELGAAEGLQVHRSHWVALAAVRGLRRINGRLFLDMADGAEIPVSRSFAPAVRERLERAAGVASTVSRASAK